MSINPKLKSQLDLSRRQLRKFRPQFRNWHFWAVQVLVIIIAASHYAFENLGYLAQLQRLYFVPIGLLAVPVVYAALNFGFAGSVATATWVMVISIPNVLFGHSGWEQMGESLQLSILLAIGIFVGHRVDRETVARHRAEDIGTALHASEVKYRGLFESSPVAIIAFDQDGLIVDANPTAGILFGKTPEALTKMAVADVMKQAGVTPKANWWEQPIVIRMKAGTDVYLEPTHTQVSDSQGNVITQVLFRDVTQERQRQAGLKAYTAHVLRAQEEERQRIARELHDETIQNLALLCRRLDNVDSTGACLPTAVGELREARKTAEEVVKELRSFTRALRPPILDDLGIVASIRRLLLDFKERASVEGQLKVVGSERRLPPDTELGMFRIAQEALWNVERHARATLVNVTIAFADGEARLEVADNGIGFAAPSTPAVFAGSGQLGLIGMTERADLLGGKLEIQSGPGQGTRVTASVPTP